MPAPVALPSIKRQKELEEEEQQQMMDNKPSVSHRKYASGIIWMRKVPLPETSGVICYRAWNNSLMSYMIF